MGTKIGSKKEKMTGWGKHPLQRGIVFRPEKKRELLQILRNGDHPPYIARGLGRSYGDAALNRNAGVILQERLNRFLAFDEETGVLTCEAGVSFAEIIDVFLPRGYFLPVTPGTKFVTVGGAIANDIHGKNHHRVGSLANYILSFELLTARGETFTCARNERANLFWATIGGIGLTGIILTVQLQLMPVETAYVEVDYKKAANLDEALELLAETEDDYEHSVAWIDCLSKGKSMGRSVLMLGNHLPREKLASGTDPFRVKQKRTLAMPIDLPSFALNRWSIKAFNQLYYSKFKDESGVVADYDSYFYPLDAIHNWNRMYGNRGFIQYQMVFPEETSREGLTAILRALSDAGRSSFLAVLKRFGAPSGGWLSFPREGYTLALDIPIRGGREFFSFIESLDQIVLEHGGVLYLAKDATLAPETFRTMYPAWKKFCALKESVDPDGLFSSSMSRRLEIVEGWR